MQDIACLDCFGHTDKQIEAFLSLCRVVTQQQFFLHLKTAYSDQTRVTVIVDAHITSTETPIIQNKWVFWRPIYRYTWALWQKSSYRHFASYLNTLENATILDLGTGTGAYIHLLALKPSTRIIFTDPDPRALVQAAAVPSPSSKNFTFDVLDAEGALAKYSNVSHLSLIHVYSVLSQPCAFLELCHRKAPEAVMLIYLSKFNGMGWLDFLSSKLGFKQVDRSLLHARFSYQSVGRLNAVYKGHP